MLTVPRTTHLAILPILIAGVAAACAKKDPAPQPAPPPAQTDDMTAAMPAMPAMPPMPPPTSAAKRGAAPVVAKARPATELPQVGARAPGFSLPDHSGGRVNLAQRVTKGPVVLVFYRGFW